MAPIRSLRAATCAALSLVAPVFAAATGAFAQTSAAEDFPVRRVSFYIGFAAGGYDSYARLVARHMGRHLPGGPEVVPMNMPGAGSVKLVQFLNGAAPTDGSAIGIIDRGLFVAIYTNPAIPKFDFAAMNWIGSITNENLLCVSWHASQIKTFGDMRKREFITGGVTQGVAWTSATVMQKMLGAKIKFISGYRAATTSPSPWSAANSTGAARGATAASWRAIRHGSPRRRSTSSCNTRLSAALNCPMCRPRLKWRRRSAKRPSSAFSTRPKLSRALLLRLRGCRLRASPSSGGLHEYDG